MSGEDGIERVAGLLLAARAARRTLAAETLDVADMAAAYRIQAACARRRIAGGDEAIGYKIGVTSAAARAMLGLDAPFFGRLFRSTSLDEPAEVAVMPGLHAVYEPEVALVLGRDLPGVAGGYDAAALRAATRAVLPCIELVATCVAPWTGAGAARLTADNGAHGHWVAGAEVEDFAGLDLMEAPVALSIDGTVAARGRPSLVDGGPFAVAAWLANTLVGMGTMLRAGDRISTGTTTQPMPIGPGQAVEADFGALGRVRVRTS